MGFKIKGTKITLTRGDTLRAQVKIWVKEDDTLTEYEPVTGDVVRFTAAQSYESAPVIEKEINISTMLLELEPEDTASLAYGDYVYDMELTMADGYRDTFIPKATLVLTEEVTK